MPSGSGRQQKPGELGSDERARLARQGLLNNSAMLLASAVGLVLVPLMLHGLGAETYGLWITAAAVAGLIGVLDLGLGFTVLREIAAAGRDSSETQAFVASAGNVFLLVGVLGGAVVGFGGTLLADHLSLSPHALQLAPRVFALQGVSFVADRLYLFQAAVLRGSRRFGSLNLLTGAWVLLRAAGLVLLLKLGRGVVPLAGWHALSAWALFFAALLTVRVQASTYALRLGALAWQPLRKHIRLSLSWQLSTWLGGIFLQIAPLLIGVIAGSAAVAPFYVGHKISQVISSMGWHSAEVLLPPSSLEHRRSDVAALSDLLRAGTRWISMLILPLCVVLWILAPTVLAAWLGEVDLTALRVLRLTLVAAAFDTVAAAAVILLWGRGAASEILKVIGLAVGVHLTLSLWLVPRIGAAGAAWGLLAAMGLAMVGFLHFAAGAVERSALGIVRSSFVGLLLPGAAGTLVTAAAAYLSIQLGGWSIAVTGAAGLGAFWIAFLLAGAHCRKA